MFVVYAYVTDGNVFMRTATYILNSVYELSVRIVDKDFLLEPVPKKQRIARNANPINVLDQCIISRFKWNQTGTCKKAVSTILFFYLKK